MEQVPAKIEKLAHFELDIGLVEGEVEHPLLEATHWVSDRLSIFCAPSHPLARGEVTLARLLEARWIMRERGSGTRSTFELAAKRLSADVLNLDINTSATSKGESLSDTLLNLEAMASDMFVVRHSQSGAPHFIAESVTPGVAIINAGDGRHAHPTQAMLDMLTIRQHKGGFEGLKVAIVGDVLHSRVARSQIRALNELGAAEVRVIAPATLLPRDVESLGCTVEYDMTRGMNCFQSKFIRGNHFVVLHMPARVKGRVLKHRVFS